MWKMWMWMLVSQVGQALLLTSMMVTAGRAKAGVNTQKATATSSLESAIGAENMDLLDAREREVLSALLERGQEHLVSEWPKKGTEDAEKKKLASTLAKLDGSYVGGLAAYVDKARDLLEAASKGENAFEGLVAKLPEGERLEAGSKAFVEAEAAGLEAITAGTGFVLVAGGLGERLGYDGIKLELPVEGLTGWSFLELYCEFVEALSKKAGKKLPLAIMTSDDTDAKTRKLLETSKYGDFVTVIKQDKVAALKDGSAGLAVDGKWDVVTKPHGHGDVHALMRSSGLARKWLDELKLESLFFFQDTNALVLHTVLATLGVAKKRHFSMNSVCVPRRAGEAAGAIASLEASSNGDSAEPPLVINVEYNQLDPLLQAAGEGDVNDPATGYSPFPGNANVLALDLADYVRTVEGDAQGVVDEFVNPKYKDASKTVFKKPTRLECMMQDYPKLLRREKPDAKVGFASFDRWLAFSPAKNDLAAARALAEQGEPPSSAGSTEFDVYQAHAVKAGLVDIDAAATKLQTLGGVSGLYAGPRIVFGPAFAVSYADLRAKIPDPSKCRLDDQAALFVDGTNVLLESLHLKNAAAAKITNTRSDATLVIRDLVLDADQGLDFSDIPDDLIPDAAPSDRIRGYATSLADGALVVDIAEPGAFLLTGDGKLSKLDDVPDL